MITHILAIYRATRVVWTCKCHWDGYCYITFVSSCGCNWLFRINSGYQCCYNHIAGMAMSSILGKLFFTAAALSDCITLFYCIGLPDFIDFLVVLFGENRKSALIVH